jgi:hypothetical protein
MAKYVTPEVSIDEPVTELVISFVLGPVAFVFAAVVWQVLGLMDYAAAVIVGVAADVVAVAAVEVEVVLNPQ